MKQDVMRRHPSGYKRLLTLAIAMILVVMGTAFFIQDNLEGNTTDIITEKSVTLAVEGKVKLQSSNATGWVSSDESIVTVTRSVVVSSITHYTSSV